MQPQQTDNDNSKIRDLLIELMKKKTEEENARWIDDMKSARDSLSKLDDPDKKKLGADQLLKGADDRIKEAEARMQKAKTASSISVKPGEKKTCTIEKTKNGYSISGIDEKTMDKATQKVADKLGYSVQKTKGKDGSIIYHITHKDGKPLTPQEMKAFMAQLHNELKKELGAQNVNAGKEFAKELDSSDKPVSAFDQPPPASGISSTS